ncbi:hypothetical protein ACF08M_07705 [Streptomyces sp. NPDC015032]
MAGPSVSDAHRTAEFTEVRKEVDRVDEALVHHLGLRKRRHRPAPLSAA